MPKPKPKRAGKRLRLTDHQVTLAVKDLHEFGYVMLSFDDVRRIADEIAEGTHDPYNPVAMILCKEIDEAVEAAKAKRAGTVAAAVALLTEATPKPRPKSELSKLRKANND